ncbi:Hypothetical protein FKW44_022037 [Caligus rogercresseyi]|uniref:Uncharacterized protein n=1 Tax=Caligus rogercresseyi TaxID=217165 RepID=A0A7T8GS79_CALRO|nr:Hypothetical protein FKW44_022037 [Caligus rogercresseyi]
MSRRGPISSKVTKRTRMFIEGLNMSLKAAPDTYSVVHAKKYGFAVRIADEDFKMNFFKFYIRQFLTDATRTNRVVNGT